MIIGVPESAKIRIADREFVGPGFCPGPGPGPTPVQFWTGIT